ncbi:hypothetical protein EDC94DRAFT_550447 [Helicostylum pulchrum]|nr:hypothetical protein EDC94DRAFT_550447 [Helicostylum pulchrum]
MLISIVSTLLFTASVVSSTTFFDLSSNQLSYNAVPKSVFIATSIGGSSHTKWVLEIGRLLADRGHNVTYVTRDDQLALADPFPKIKAVSTGPPVYSNVLGKVETLNFYQIAKVVRKFLNNAYTNDMEYYQQLFTTQQVPDLFICDAFNDPCIDTAVALNIPFVITCTGILHQDMSVPYINSLGTTPHATSQSMTIWERFHHKYIDLIKTVYHLYPEMMELDQLRVQFGIPGLGLNRFKKWDNALKLINSYFGFQPSQILSPLTHMIGPVLSERQKELDPEEKRYLDTHKRVAYVAFGQIAVPNKREIQILLSALLDQVNRNQLDGIIWVGLKKHVALIQKKDLSNWRLLGKVVQSPLDFDHIFMPTWAAQFAILSHPSTVLFVSHGGAESANEATFNGVPLLINPYFGDQRLVGRALTIAGVARVYDRDTSTFDLVKHKLDELLLDPQGHVAHNVSRMQVLAQIGTKRKTFAADLVEEHMFASHKGIAHHRFEVSRHISTLKAMDIDLHATVLTFIALTGFTFHKIINALF